MTPRCGTCLADLSDWSAFGTGFGHYVTCDGGATWHKRRGIEAFLGCPESLVRPCVEVES